jgi:putative endonuclease
LRPVARNFRSRGGEIDLIMLDGDCLVFIEVRCRTSGAFTHPALTVDRRKQRKVVRTAALFVAARPRLALCTMRFDVVAVQGQDESGISWVRDAFRPDDSSF